MSSWQAFHSKFLNAPPAVQKQMIGEMLYPRIARLTPKWAGNITGMMLEMDNSELLAFLEDESNLLHIKVNEVLEIIAPQETLPPLHSLVATLHPTMDDDDSVTIRCTNISGEEIAVVSVEPWRTMDSVRKSIAQTVQISQHEVQLIGQDAQVYDDKCYVAEILPAGILPTTQILGWLADLLEDAPLRKAALSQLLPLVAKLRDAEGKGQRQGTANAQPKGKGEGKGIAKGKGKVRAARVNGKGGAKGGKCI